MKDFIYIYDNNNKEMKMEVILKINLANEDNNYIVYKDDKEEYYCAKYIDSNVIKLDTNLKESELKLCKTFLERVVKYEIKN